MPVAADLSPRLARCAALLCLVTAALADDGRGLKRGGDPNQVSISGLSSGAAMAVQYAVAHSASVTAVGAVAGPQWGCAGGSVSRAINDCMCGRAALTPTINTARQLAARGAIDKLTLGRPQSLRRAWVFQSPADETVSSRSGEADATFLTAFIGTAPEVDRGNAVDGSDRAGHGIIAPGGSDTCAFDGTETSYVRHCGAEDNAGKMFQTLFGEGSAYNPSDRAGDVPEAELWSFDQKRFIEQAKARGVSVADDYYNPFWFWWPASSARRQNFDMAEKGYIYVPPSCRAVGSACRVHVALHGCKQDARVFASKAGYNNWAERYKVIVVYPAIAPGEPVAGTVCRSPAVDPSLDAAWAEPNPNGCWDWWGYLDTSSQQGRYLTSEAPQMQVLRAIITAATASQAN
ncbi:putative depolymerase [Methylobacterium sp. 4-46]|uniref:extracellular catalytic domain type 2 short-chain-length polyhydroxyalkanoate depolymerase n=1 Tax=unclassified Methylobacterium TaxID=2615210 RepID=UPI000152D2AB|nr:MULTISPECIES: PHB depolymerase family esterase [Methylobacterium]ACA19864.1 putative depolymerase [Methylobacterium sp. 4-46]WFT79047.1 PHB depolymerase family esterase [Methylobacterium nodulans]